MHMCVHTHRMTIVKHDENIIFYILLNLNFIQTLSQRWKKEILFQLLQIFITLIGKELENKINVPIHLNI